MNVGAFLLTNSKLFSEFIVDFNLMLEQTVVSYPRLG